MSDVVDRLKEACVGKPAHIPWPYYLLHESIDEIGDLRDSLRLIRDLLKGRKKLDATTALLLEVCEDGLTGKGGELFYD